jgi:regulator of sirC expression with transglutaminase-like and TPR domain
MHLERMHRTLKYIYLKGKTVKRLDKAINAIMKLVRDKLYEKLIIIRKGIKRS